MRSNIRFGGAQIPCTDNLEQNVEILKNAISWAAENSVDYLITPEGSLTGYFPGFDSKGDRTIEKIYLALDDVVLHSKANQVGLCLGTMWADNVFGEYIKENQIRFYNKNGKFLGKVNKTYTIPEYDQTVPNDHIDNVLLDFNDDNFSVLGLICNDFWGGPPDGKLALPTLASNLGSHIIMHSTNGFRGETPSYDSLMNDWHNANLRMMSWVTKIPIITVDNCYYMQGYEYHGRTSSESGVLVNGDWVTAVPREGTQYFYYDFDFDSLINRNLDTHQWLTTAINKW
jgi:predicted amidohydrolase